MGGRRASERRANGSGSPRRWRSCVVLPCWGLLWVCVVATRRHGGRRCGLCRGRPRARAGGLWRGVGGRTPHHRPGQHRLARGRRVGNKRCAGPVGTDGVGSRWARRRGSFGLHWIVRRLGGRAVADPWQLMGGNWIL